MERILDLTGHSILEATVASLDHDRHHRSGNVLTLPTHFGRRLPSDSRDFTNERLLQRTLVESANREQQGRLSQRLCHSSGFRDHHFQRE